jgi:hypothetical protein
VLNLLRELRSKSEEFSFVLDKNKVKYGGGFKYSMKDKNFFSLIRRK